MSKWNSGFAVAGAIAMTLAAQTGIALAQTGGASLKDAAQVAVGTVMTVQGPVNAGQLGMTLVHEHFLDDLNPADDTAAWRAAGIVVPATPEARAFYAAPMSMARIGRAYMGEANRDNLRLDDEAVAVREATDFKWLGGSTIVDLTAAATGRDPVALIRIAERTGLHVVMGAGGYMPGYMGDAFENVSVAELAKRIVHELTEGVGTSGIRAGIIGEIHIVDAGQTEAQDALRAAAEASRRTGAAISVSFAAGSGEQLQVLDVLARAGANPARVALGHANAIANDMALMRKLLARGAYLQFDTLGRPPTVRTKVSDHDVAVAIKALFAAGYGEQILLSQDVHQKTDRKAWGGSGYSFLPTQYIPYMRRLGITAAEIHRMVVENPQRLLAFAEPQEGEGRP